MKKRGTLLFCLVLFINLLIAQDYNPYKLTSDLQNEVTNTSITNHRVFILLEEQIDFVQLKESFKLKKIPLADRSKTVINYLKDNASQTQPQLLDFLINNNGVKAASIQSFWISNALFAEVTTKVLKELTLRSDIQLIEPEKEVKAIDYEWAMGPFLQPEGLETGLEAINAPAMWELGYTCLLYTSPSPRDRG